MPAEWQKSDPRPSVRTSRAVELGKFNKAKEALISRRDQWMFLFNHLHQLNKPLFPEDPIFQRLFQVTEYNKLNLEDQVMIIDRERDMRNMMNRLRREVRMEAERNKELIFARTLIRDTDFTDQKIAELTGVEEELIAAFRADQ